MLGSMDSPSKIEKSYSAGISFLLIISYFFLFSQICWQNQSSSFGNEVATLVDEYKPAGMYNEQFTMYNLASGIYFYQLNAGDFVQKK